MWKPVFDKLLADIAYKTTGTIFVFVGEEAKQFAKHVRKGQYRFFIPEVTQRNGWDPIDIFNRINSLLEITEKEPINW
jgi:uracil DNA glycosylase